MDSVQKDIITILKAYLHADYTFDIENDIREIIDCANKYAITPVIEYTLAKANKCNRDNSSVYLNAMRVEKQNNLRKTIKEVFDKNNIGYVFIKGTTLAKYYVDEYLRFSSDVDVVVQKDNYLRSRDILVNEYDFVQHTYSDNEMSLTDKYGTNLDLHCLFTKKDDEIEALYKDVNYSKHELDNELKLFHICNHGAKHINNGFISLQYLIDLYYVDKLDINREKFNELLNKANLDKFYVKTRKLVDVLFEDEIADEDTKLYIEFLFNGKQTKGRENFVRINRAKKNTNKLVYILSRLFPDYKAMSSNYPELINKKYLLPVYYVKRAIDIINRKDRLSNAKAEFGYCLNDVDENVQKTKKLFENLGI